MTDSDVLAQFGFDEDIHRSEWRALLDAGKTPGTHVAREGLLAEGFHGVIYPSFMSPGGTCVALWRWNTPDAPRLDVVDPDERLPKTPASWV